MCTHNNAFYSGNVAELKTFPSAPSYTFCLNIISKCQYVIVLYQDGEKSMRLLNISMLALPLLPC